MARMMDDLSPLQALFGLREQPFAATADPVYFYATAGHKECLYRLWHGVDERHGIAVVLGNYGTGKTTMMRKLLIGMKADPDKYNVAVIGAPIPSWTSFALLENIVNQFGLKPSTRSFMAYMEALNGYLIENRKRINTLIIDDAQNLNKRGQLELLRLAQNLETPQHKLLNLLLFAQLEWSPILKAAPNFAQRINMSYVLRPLDLEETRSLIAFRLQQAGAKPENIVFTDAAIQTIHAYAEGSPRVTVSVCRNTLVAAARLKQRTIDPELVIHTIERTTLPGNLQPSKPAPAPAPAPQPVMAESAAPAPPVRRAADMPSRPMPDPESMRESASDLGMSRDERARQILLRSMRGQPGPESR